ncbi:MAG: pyridoxine 5'-phosphate synthase [Deltaproteobacteria bacterium]|nr:pyridoxine 5'-phosphate synthase [Deltaproteobacteria bacterium]
MSVKLHVNVDHVATLRQARGTSYPDPVDAALACEAAGAHGITVHQREDRRHIQPHDVERLRVKVKTILNLEMAATDAMVELATRVKPDFVTLVPEKREERTTEGGLDVAGQRASLAAITKRLHHAGISVSMFIDPEPAQIDASIEVGADHIELHTGDYANATGDRVTHELDRIGAAARHNATSSRPLHLAAGHGLSVANVGALLEAAPEIVELNVGHAIVSDAVIVGMEEAVRRFLRAMERT